MAMGVVDTIMVGRVSATDLAAVAIGHLYFFVAAVFGMGVLSALDPVVSQAVGASDDVAVARAVQRGGVLAALLSVLAVALMVPVRPMLTLLGQPPEAVPVAADYVYTLMAGVTPFYLFLVLRQSLQAMGRVRVILIVALAANLVNAFLNWLLIFGNWGFSSLGAVGSGWATTGSRWFMLVALLVLGWPLLAPSLRHLRRDALAARPLRRLLRVGAPVGVQQGLEFGVFGAAGLLVGLLGAIPLASHQVALQLAALTFMVPLGVAQATCVLVGQAVGRGDPHGARRATGAGLAVGVGFMAMTAVALLLAPGPLARIFSHDGGVVATAAVLLPIAGVFQVFDGIQVVAAGALRGIGDTSVPMIVNLVGFWLIGLPVSAVLGLTWGGGPAGIWWGLATGIAAVALLLTDRVRRRFGRELRRLVIDEEGAVS